MGLLENHENILNVKFNYFHNRDLFEITIAKCSFGKYEFKIRSKDSLKNLKLISFRKC